MKNRASLSLMEQLIMILVFALSATLCLQGFAAADRISQKTGQVDHAIHHVQNTAELLKAHSGNIDSQLPSCALTTTDGWVVYYNENWEPEEKKISLNLQIDESICTMYEYFDIFLERMMMCRGAAEMLGCKFRLTVNGGKVL